MTNPAHYANDSDLNALEREAYASSNALALRIIQHVDWYYVRAELMDYAVQEAEERVHDLYRKGEATSPETWLYGARGHK